MTIDRLNQIAELLHACPEPGIANGYDLCPCGTGEVWPCAVTQAAWLAAGKDRTAEVRAVLDAAKQQMEAEQADWEALRENAPAAAQSMALRRLGWHR